MYTLKYNPGDIDGCIVMKDNGRIVGYDKVFDHFEWEDEDIGNWQGVRQHQKEVYRYNPVFDPTHVITWTVFTLAEYTEFESRFS
jgi:hypothetical protein